MGPPLQVAMTCAKSTLAMWRYGNGKGTLLVRPVAPPLRVGVPQIGIGLSLSQKVLGPDLVDCAYWRSESLWTSLSPF